MDLSLWKMLTTLKRDYDWVDLSYEVSPDTPHHPLFPDLTSEPVLNIAEHGASTYLYSLVSQYGTHVDPPCHFVEGGRAVHEITLDEMAYPLCVIDVSEKVKDNFDYSLSVQDIVNYEAAYGEIPAGSFVAMRTDWSKRIEAKLDSIDADGNSHYPGWSLEALKFLVEQRNIGAIGHEPADTDAGADVIKAGWAAELYLLEQDKIQIELMRNLDQLPAKGAILFCFFPKVKDGTGFTVRPVAVKPRG